MAIYYEESTADSAPVNLATVRDYLKIPASVTKDDSLLQTLIDTAVELGEARTSRAFRNKVLIAYMDCFPTYNIIIKKTVLDSITAFTYPVASVDTAVPAASYYIKKHSGYSEILLKDGYSWPTDGDVIEQGIKITLSLTPYPKPLLIEESIKLFVAYAYANRGDCDDDTIISNSGAGRVWSFISPKSTCLIR